MQIIVPSPTPRPKLLSVTLDPAVHEQIVRLASEAGVSQAEVARQLILDALKRVDPKV